MAAIPILALLPLLGAAAGAGDEHSAGEVLLEALKIVGVIGAIVLGGRLLLRPLLRWIAKSRTPEIFTAASLLLVVGIAYLMVMVGLSMALGAFWPGCCWPTANTAASWKPTSSPSRACCWASSSSRWA